jgi:DNA helicase HerA-like ATPase
MDITKSIGVITRGSLEKGVEMKLHPDESVEDIKAGTFLVVRGQNYEFFSMITDVTLDASNNDILLHPPDEEEELLLKVLQGAAIYTTVKLKPMLMLPIAARALPTADSSGSDFSTNDDWASHKVKHLNGVLANGTNGTAQNGSARSVAGKDEALPVKTVPTHFSRVYRASEEDVARIFGREDKAGSDWFNVGSPIDMETPVCLNLPKFVERSNGIFGKSGTGKTFLTRTVLCGLIHHQPDVVNLIFDAHNEYGWEARSEGGAPVKGLCQIFGKNKVKIYSLDAESSRARNVGHVEEVKIPLGEIMQDDLLSMQRELNLADAAAESAYLVRNRFGKEWLLKLLDLGSDEDLGNEAALTLAQQVGGHEGSVSALQRKLKSSLVRNGKLLPFLSEKPVGRDILDTMLHDIQMGTNIVLEFGSQQSSLVYLLVANVLTRRLHAHYVKEYEAWVGRGMKKSDEPKKLMITIEEAHKFLNPQAARQTIFGTIAREMRKYWVTLLIVDQRPSGIDDEILSQIGTRITAQLNDEADINAVLTGVNGATGLKGVLAQLDSKQQALVLGHSVPMPVMIQTRRYDNSLWSTLGRGDLDDPNVRATKLRDLDDI